jgi:hypothetical protein
MPIDVNAHAARCHGPKEISKTASKRPPIAAKVATDPKNS